MLQDLIEAREEGSGGNDSREDIADRLGDEDAEDRVRQEMGQDKDEWDQQDELAQAGQQEADLCLTQSHKTLLTADLHAAKIPAI